MAFRLLWFFNVFHLVTTFSDAIVMMSYNILGDNNCMWHTELYQNIPQNLMNWESRRRLIFLEISERNPDLVCLQVTIYFKNMFDFHLKFSTFFKLIASTSFATIF